MKDNVVAKNSNSIFDSSNTEFAATAIGDSSVMKIGVKKVTVKNIPINDLVIVLKIIIS
ncbi:MAG: hypothetical protein NW220_22810 [Leptolyngbyaceae cyanobacterium bins.349]|nr:hypothetical protein [Leptolyngbyaceae cyanobacterium bins.349]